MHELSLVQSIVDQISELSITETFTKVSRLRLEIGALSGVNAECIEFSFSEVSPGTPLEGADLVIQNIPLTVNCNECHQQTCPDVDDIKCQTCESREVTILSGKDFKMIDLDVE